jgi:hypothetical protein
MPRAKKLETVRQVKRPLISSLRLVLMYHVGSLCAGHEVHDEVSRRKRFDVQARARSDVTPIRLSDFLRESYTGSPVAK